MHDAPHRAEQAHKRRDACRRREKCDAVFELVHLDDRRAHQRPVDGRETLEYWTPGGASRIGSHARVPVRRRLAQLSRELGVAGLEQSDERTVVQRSTDGLHLRELVAATEHLEKTLRLAPGAAQRPEFVEDDGP